uniref:Uncharacterized protein n=1 Tax=Tetraselmis chuii TaxID=63592 RepID=A0A7S1SX53_9CHLO|mmetsp:Transcript_34388/g.61371  ORF Transcript_34388/g.61371 Transcript_34388/m.61371 type:complete len:201 (+) Transcript_34388:153-755(+)|eukprot:CAMPEP_0177779894 /NCGR_PEP_ID=MMETSP0491_2-20121128/16880_1 /TAXON_ID=63592 /ORGANISM="Tetraselmis chuii, Strain PLY429" /LENGTH=200 /DNA_ID=CAMNT_0019299563 /DNA_START=143 /DNA_END=745 /DNA_ORIENTATION=+
MSLLSSVRHCGAATTQLRCANRRSSPGSRRPLVVAARTEPCVRRREQLRDGAALALSFVAFPACRAQAAENAAILKGLQRYSGKQGEFSLEEQELAGRDRLLGAQAQLTQVNRLAASGRYNDARLQLREGAMKNVRRDLRAAEQELGGLSSDTGNALIQAIEALDQGLKAEAPQAELKQLLDAVSKAVDAVQAELILPTS